MNGSALTRVAGVVAVGLACSMPSVAYAQDLGHKLLGSVGIDAGSQPETGIYLVDQFVYYGADTLTGRDGSRLPVGLDLDAYATLFGVAATLELVPTVYFNASVGVPFSGISVSVVAPEASTDAWGLADVVIQPLKLGWRGPGLDLTASVTLLAPTRTFGEGPLARSQWSEQFSGGGTLFFMEDRSLRLSLVTSYDLYNPKRGVDVVRGDTLSFQGGFGTTLSRLVDVGATFYALAQVRDNRGDDLPPVLLNARDRVIGLGLEVGAPIPRLRTKLRVSWAHDIDAQARPEGQIVVVRLSSLLWR